MGRSIKCEYCGGNQNFNPKTRAIECEHCGKPTPYPFHFCSECAEKLLGEPPKPIDPPEREIKYDKGRNQEHARNC